MTVIDALVVTLGLDPKQYEKGRKDVDAGMKDLREKSAKTAKEMEEQGKKAAAFFSSVKVELLGLLAAFGAATGLKDFIGSSVTGMADLGRASANVGVATQRLQAWGAAAEATGGQASDALNSFQTIASGIAEAQIKGTSAFTNWARMNGVALTDQNKQLLNTEQIMMNIRKRAIELASTGPGGRQRAISFLGMGGFSEANANLLLMPGFDAFMTKAEAIAQRNKKIADSAQRVQVQYALLKLRFQAISDRAFIKLEPVLEKLATRLANWLDSIDWNKVINQATALAKSVNGVVQEFGGWKTVAIALGVILGAKLLAPLIGIVANLGTMGGGILSLIGMTTGLRGLAATFGGLAAAIAAASGAIAGYYIYTHYLQGTKAGDEIGEGAARAAAALGIPGAQQALDDMHHRGPENHSGDFHPERTEFYKTRKQEALKFFMDHGWSMAQAAGIVANIGKESGFKENAVGDRGKAFGLGQWHKDRQAEFAQWMGRSIVGTSFQDQLAFINYELTHNEKRAGDLLRKTRDASVAGMLVSLDYERPANAQTEALARGKSAQDIYLGGVQVGAASIAAAKAPASSTTNTSTSQTHIGTINVQTKATDANGIGRDIRTAIANNAVVAQADTGLN